MTLSILIPMYNAKDYIGNCIESLLNQNISSRDYEIIIIDDGSQDNSVDIVKAYIKQHENIKLFLEPNSGTYSTRNKLLKLAKGEYIYSIDADDYIVNNCLGSLLKIAQNNQLDIIGFETKETTSLKLKELNNTIDNDSVELHTGKTFLVKHKYFRYEVWWYFIKKDFIEKNNIFFIDNEYNADVIFTLKSLLKADRVGYLPQSFHRYVLTSDSLKRSYKFENVVKRIDSYKMMIADQSKIINEIKKESDINNAIIINNLQHIRAIFTFFNILNLCRNSFSTSYIKDHIASYKEAQAYPIKNFTINKYNSLFYRVLNFLINRIYFIYAFVYVKNIFKKPKL